MYYLSFNNNNKDFIYRGGHVTAEKLTNLWPSNFLQFRFLTCRFVVELTEKGYNDGDKFSRCKSKMRMNNGLRFFKVACHTSS